MRERLAAYRFRRMALRITPAYAGKTEKGLKNGSISEDHPRVCGKDFT